MSRYSKNGILTPEAQDHLSRAKVCVVGCGGLGGYTIEMLGRIGIGHLTIIDPDNFDMSNLNRQLLSSEDNIGQDKVEVAHRRLSTINSTVVVEAHLKRLGQDNAETLVSGHDVVVDALDSIETRRILQEACERQEVPLVSGAIAGWYGQVCTIFPGDRLLDQLYKGTQRTGVETTLGNPSFTPALVSAIQVSETIKVLLDDPEVLRFKVLHIDLKYNEFNLIEL